MTNEIEVEIKSDCPLSTHPSLAIECDVCGERATRAIEFGEVQNYYGSGQEVDVCENKRCMDAAMEKYAESVLDVRVYRREYAQQEQWDRREGR